MRALQAEWLKLRRPMTLAAFTGVLVVAAVVVTTLVFLAADSGGPRQGEPGQGASFTSTLGPDELSAADGLAVVFGVVGGTLAPLATLVLFATSVGAEYRLQTIRMVLVKLPQRHAFLAGKLLALAALTAASLIGAFLATALTGYALSGVAGVDTGRWSAAEGIAAAAAQLVNTFLMSVGWGIAAAALALLARSSATAIGIGLGYLLVLENLATAAWSGGRAWLPGQLLSAVGSGGTGQTAYGRAAALSLVYVVVLLAAGGTLLQQRDVTE